MDQNYFQKMSSAIAMAESVRYLNLSLDELGEMCDIPSPVLEAAIYSVSPEILPMRERLRGLLDGRGSKDGLDEFKAPAGFASPIDDFEVKYSKGIRRSSYEKYAESIRAFATSTRPLPKICRDNNVPYSACREFMMRYYPEAARRHIDILEGRFALKQPSDELTPQ